MNLAAKEFVAARDDEQGVLILSSFAGASRELSEALIVNPYDTSAMAATLERASDAEAGAARPHAHDARADPRAERLSLGGAHAHGRFAFAQARTHSRQAKGTHPGPASPGAHPSARLGVDHYLEASIDHALRIEGHVLHVHAGDALVLHHLGVDPIAVRPRFIHDPREDHRLARLELDAARERRELTHLYVVGDACATFERAVRLPDLASLLRQALIGLDLLLRHRQYKSIDIGHGTLRSVFSIQIATLLGRFPSAIPHRHDHPGDAEAVSHHAEARREERLGKRHLYRAALAESGEQSVSFGLVGRRDRQGKSLEVWLALAVAVRSHDPRLADAKAGMQYLVVRPRWHLHAVRGVLEAHQRLHLGAQSAFVELNCLLTAAVELKIRLNLHVCPPCVGEGVRRRADQTVSPS